LVPELTRLRLSSLDPAEIDEELWQALAEEPRLMPHWHLSLQAGADLILKRMKRRHSRDQAIAVADRARALRPDMVFGADVIAGFPTETEAHFQDSLDLVAEIGIAHLHVFPYSPRPGTPAAKMPQVPGLEIKTRATRLRAAGDQVYTAFLDGEVGRQATVLIERNATGHTERFAPVTVANAEEGTLHTVRIARREGNRLLAA
jgi:threonylcarbamoyladenosine tRNA methylthiotransferase MtaB